MRNCTRLADIFGWRVGAFCARWLLCCLHFFFETKEVRGAAKLTEFGIFIRYTWGKFFKSVIKKTKRSRF